MHADVIVVGSGWQAFLIAHMFSNRGMRTLVFPASKDLEPARHILLQKEVALQMRPVMPPDSAIVSHSVNFELWSPSEHETLALKQLPFYVVDSHKYEKYLLRQALATRNMRVIGDRKVGRPLVEGGSVHGVTLMTGEDVEARLVVDCGVGRQGMTGMLDSLWRFPTIQQYMGAMGAQRRAVGEAASAWQMGTFSYHFVTGRSVNWRYRYAADRLEVGAVAPPGVSTRIERVNHEAFVEAGLGAAPDEGSFTRATYLGPPLPVSCCGGYVAVGRAAGQANPFLPLDISGAFTGSYLAFTACMHALEEGDLRADMLWVYSRSMARRWVPAQTYSWLLTRYLFGLDARRFDALLSCGVLDEYSLSCLVRNQVNEEGALERLARLGRGLTRLPAALSWGGVLRRASRAARICADAPYEWNTKTVGAWQDRVLSCL